MMVLNKTLSVTPKRDSSPIGRAKGFIGVLVNILPGMKMIRDIIMVHQPEGSSFDIN